jgi:hypothetical protein
MTERIYISIPTQYSNEILTIKALGLEGNGPSPEDALLECIKNTALYDLLIVCEFHYSNDTWGYEHLLLQVPFSTELYNKIIEVEPLPELSKKKKRNSSLILEPASEDILKYGF